MDNTHYIILVHIGFPFLMLTILFDFLFDWGKWNAFSYYFL